MNNLRQKSLDDFNIDINIINSIMAQTPEFKYAPMFQLGKDDTEYYLLTKDYVSVGE